jgi:hypothetical protein
VARRSTRPSRSATTAARSTIAASGSPGIARTTALALYTEAMHDALVAYQEDRQRAEMILAAALERFTADAAALDAADLKVEVELGTALLALVRANAPQGTLYGPP